MQKINGSVHIRKLKEWKRKLKEFGMPYEEAMPQLEFKYDDAVWALPKIVAAKKKGIRNSSANALP